MLDSDKNLNEASLEGVAGGEGEDPKKPAWFEKLAKGKNKGNMPPSLISGNPNGSGSTPSNS